jgi:recombination protein RecA
VDVEGAFDLDWAKVNGFNDDWHIVARSEYAEQAIDIIDAAVRSKAFDLIILDSIAALTPTKEIEETTENWQIGLAARLVNKALRKWIASFNAVAQDGKREGPCILALNQFRINVGQMFGDNRTAPGGQGQRFASSIRIYTKSTKIIDDPESKETAYAQLSGVIHKNKTFVSMLEYSFQLAVRDTERYKKGDIDNDAELVRQGKKYGLCKKIGGGFGYDIITAANEKAFQDKLLEQPKLARKLWKEIILAATT